MAYDTGCKGIAVYRDGSRNEQVLSTGKTGSQAGTDSSGKLSTVEAPDSSDSVPLVTVRNGRPATLLGATAKLTTGHGPMYVTMNDDEYGPRECFIVLGKPGGTASAFSDALGRMISLAEKHGATPVEVVHQLRGIQDGHPAGVGPNAVLSVPDGVARAMAEHYLDAREKPSGYDASLVRADLPLPIIGACPDCGGELVPESGCAACHACGYSRCS